MSKVRTSNRGLAGYPSAVLQIPILAVLLGSWYGLTETGILPKFFFGEPIKVFGVIWNWFTSGESFPHLGVTLIETVLAFLVGALLGLGIGLWLALSPTASRLADPYIKAANADRKSTR